MLTDRKLIAALRLQLSGYKQKENNDWDNNDPILNLCAQFLQPVEHLVGECARREKVAFSTQTTGVSLFWFEKKRVGLRSWSCEAGVAKRSELVFKTIEVAQCTKQIGKQLTNWRHG